MDENNQGDDSQQINVTVNSSNNDTAPAPEPIAPTPEKPTNEPMATPPEKPKKSKKWLIVLLAIVVIAGGGFLFWNASQDNVQEAPVASQDEASTESQEEQSQIAKPYKIIYVHGSEGTDKQAYSRMIEEGERTDLGFAIPSGASASSGIASITPIPENGRYIFNDLDTIWGAEADGQPNKIVKVPEGESITSAVISADGNSIAYSSGPAFSSGSEYGKGTYISTINFDGTNQQTIYTDDNSISERNFVVVEGWDSANNIAYFSNGCLQCDGRNVNISKTNGDGSSSSLFNGDLSAVSYPVVFKKDYSEFLVTQRKSYSDEEAAAINFGGSFAGPTGPPYTLLSVTTMNGSSSTIATYGEMTDAQDGKWNPSIPAYATTEEGYTPAYTYNDSLFIQNGDGSFSNTYTHGSGYIGKVLYASREESLVTNHEEGNYSEFTLNHFVIEGQKSSLVLNGDQYTSFLTLINQ